MNRARLTLDLDESLRREVKEAAAREGISMRDFCVRAIEARLAALRERRGSAFVRYFEDGHRRMLALNAGRPFGPLDMAEAVRETRRERDRQLREATGREWPEDRDEGDGA